jgi:hypothetical protein
MNFNKVKSFLYRHSISILIFAVIYYISYYYLEEESKYHRETEKKYSFWDFLTLSFGTQTVTGTESVDKSHFITKVFIALQKLVDEII